MSLTPLPAALTHIFEQLPPPPPVEHCPLDDCLMRVLGESVVASMDVPPLDNSAMDGYAVRVCDLPGELPVSQRIFAGAPAAALEPGTAARIFTGAIVPPGADAVVMQEDAIERDGRVSILGCLSPGQHIRRRGADINADSEILLSGQVLTPQALGLAASVGVAFLPVYRRLRVAVFTTGDELVDPGQQAQPWQIFNSNDTQLTAQLRQLGVDPVLRATLGDEPELIGRALEAAAAEVDCIITCGGVSVGEADYVREQIEARGTLSLWKLAIKPGKPLAFGSVSGCPIFGLPGNPVSAWSTFGLVVKPWLMRAQGATLSPPARIAARAGFSVDRPGTREDYLRVTLTHDDPPRADLAGSQSSGVLSAVAKADGLAVIPTGTTVTEGDTVSVITMTEFLSPLVA